MNGLPKMKNKIIKSGLVGLVLLGGLFYSQPAMATKADVEINICGDYVDEPEDSSYNYKPSIVGMLGDEKLEFSEAKEIVSSFGTEMRQYKNNSTLVEARNKAKESLSKEIMGIESLLIYSGDEGNNQIKEMQKEFEENILGHYPGLLDEKVHTTYNGESYLDPLQKDRLNLMINNLKIGFDASVLQELSDRNGNLRIMDALNFYNLIKKFDVKSNPDLIEKKRSELLAKKQEFNNLISTDFEFNETLVSEDENILINCSTDLENYLTLEGLSNELKAKSNIRKYIGTSFFHYIFLDTEKKFYEIDFADEQRGFRTNLKSCLVVNSSLDSVKIEKLPNPQRAKLPGWFNFLLGIAFPIATKLVVPKYWSKRETDISDVVSTTAATLIGTLGLDALHPLAYPIRLLYPIFLEEPLRKAFGWKETIEEAKKRRHRW